MSITGDILWLLLFKQCLKLPYAVDFTTAKSIYITCFPPQSALSVLKQSPHFPLFHLLSVRYLYLWQASSLSGLLIFIFTFVSSTVIHLLRFRFYYFSSHYYVNSSPDFLYFFAILSTTFLTVLLLFCFQVPSSYFPVPAVPF